MENQNRIGRLDTCKAIAIWLMLVAHASLGADSPIGIFIFAFHMPLFFFVYGVQVSRERAGEKNPRTVFLKGLYTYILPYIVFGLLIDGIWPDTHLTLKRLALILLGTHQSRENAVAMRALWFLPCIFLAGVAYHIWCRICRRLSAGAYTGLSCVVILPLLAVASRLRNPSPYMDLPWALNVAPAALAFMLAGSVLRPYILKAGSTKKIYLFSAGVALLIVCGVVNLYNVRIIRQLGWGYFYVDMGHAIYGSIKLFFAVACAGTLGALALSFAADNKFFEFVGRYTLGIMLFQNIADRIVRLVPFDRLLPYPAWNITVATLNLFVALALSYILGIVFPPALGKPFKKRPLSISENGGNRAYKKQ